MRGTPWLLSWLLLSSCAHSGQSPRASSLKVIDGQETDAHPAIVRLLLKDKKGEELGTCTGEYVSAATVLTAAHCFDDEALAELKIGEQTFPMEAFKLHPQYVPFAEDSVKYDLALVRFKDYHSTAVLEFAPQRPGVGSKVTIVGFGKNEFTTRKGAGIGVKRMGQATIAAVEEGYLRIIKSKGSSDSASAPGDSGGAMLVEDRLLGVTSLGAPEGEGTIVNHFVDLTSEDSRKFFSASAEEGWQFGRSGTRGNGEY